MSTLLPARTARPPLWLPLAGSGVALLVLYWLALATGVGTGSPLVTHWTYLLVLVMPTVGVILRVVGSAEDRLAWGVLGVGLVLWSTGSVVNVARDLAGVTPDYPGVSDALWLSQYPLTLFAFAVLARGRLRRPSLGLGLDAAMVALVVAAIGLAFVLPDVLENTHKLSLDAQIVHLAYPIGDAVLVALAVTAAILTGWRAGGTWALLATGALALLVADLLWASAGGSWEPVTTASALYPVWPSLVAAAASLPARGRRMAAESSGEARILATALGAILVAVAMLVANEWIDVPAAATLLAALGLLTAVHRPALALVASVRASRCVADERRLLEEFEEALRERRLLLHFQPLVEADTGTVHGAEALLRWPTGDGFLPPDRFLPAVERSPLLMQALTDFVVDNALEALAAWRRAGHTLGVSVNLAAANIVDEDLPRRIAERLEAHGVSAEALTLEITETDAVEDSEAADRVLAALHALGTHLAVDDFGTGHSSLARLARFPIDEVKVDRSFVRDLGSTERPIVATTIQLAHTLGFRVVAEGVEDVPTLNALRGMGCDLAQGYLIARPLPRERFGAWLDERSDAVEPDNRVRAALAGLVSDLGVDAAFVTRFVGDRAVLQAAEGSGLRAMEGVDAPRSETYCDRVVRGVFPNLIPRPCEDERTRDLPLTRATNLGAYLGVPLVDAEGGLYGTLCCISFSERDDLGERDVDHVQAVAEQLRPVLADAHLTVARAD